MRDDINVAERTVAAYYLSHQFGTVMASPVRAEHFTANPRLGEVWKQAEREQSVGKPWLPMNSRDLDLVNELDRERVIHNRRWIERYESIVLEHAEVKHAQCAVRELDRDMSNGVMSVAETLERLHEISGRLAAGGPVMAKTLADVGAERLKDWVSGLKRADRPVLPMPWERLARDLGGWRLGKLHFIGAVTSGHKTTALRQAAFHHVKDGGRATIINLEDSAGDVADRTIAAETQAITVRELSNGVTELGEIALHGFIRSAIRLVESEEAKRFAIIDDLDTDVSRVVGAIEREAGRGVQFVGVDFLQLISSKGDQEHQMMKSICVALQRAAKRLGVAIVCAVQITQEATKAGRPPTLGDLRGGSAISQASHGVVILHRRPVAQRGFSDEMLVFVRKWKSAPRGVYAFRVDPKHDLIVDAGDEVVTGGSHG